MKAVADTLAVARSNLIERASRAAKPRRRYRKAGDEPLLALIRWLADERPTYGVPAHDATGEPAAKGRRQAQYQCQAVLRIMQANQLTLERHTGRRPGLRPRADVSQPGSLYATYNSAVQRSPLH